MGLKLFGKNAAIYAAGNLLQRASYVALIPLYTHFLTVDQFGLLDTANVTIQLAVLFMGLGMPASVVRFYAESERGGTAGQLAGVTLGVIAAAILAGSLLALAIAAAPVPGMTAGLRVLIVLIALHSAAQCLAMHFLMFYRAMNRALPFTGYSLAITLITIAFTASWFYAAPHKLHGALACRAAAYGLAALAMGAGILKTLRPSFGAGKARELFSFGFPTIFVAAGWFVMESSDRYFLAYYRGMEEVGIYALGYKLTFLIMVFIVMPFQLAYGPFIFSNLNRPTLRRDIGYLLTLLVLALTAGGYFVVAFGGAIVALAAPEAYGNSVLAAWALLPGALLTGIYYWASNTMHIVKKTSYIAYIILGASAMNIALNWMLIPPFGWPGAAAATNLSIGAAVAAFCELGRRLYPVPLETRRLAIAGALALALAAFYPLTRLLPPAGYCAANLAALAAAPFALYFAGFYNERELWWIRELAGRAAGRVGF